MSEPADLILPGYTTKDYAGQTLYVCRHCGHGVFDEAQMQAHVNNHPVYYKRDDPDQPVLTRSRDDRVIGATMEDPLH